MQQLGARPVINGVVKDEQTIPEGPGIIGGGQSFSVIRKAGEDGRTVANHKTAEGDTVQWEIPTMEEQIRRQMLLGAPQRAAAVQQAGDLAQAQARGRGAGESATRAADLQARGVRLGDVFDADTIKKYGMNPDYRDLPENIKTMFPADIRGVATTTGAGIRADTQKTVAQMRADAAQRLQDAKEQFQAEQNAQKLDYQNRWQQARAAISGDAQSNINNRTQLRLFDADQKQHSTLLDNAFKEEQRALSAQALLDTQETTGMLGQKTSQPAVNDGEEFTDPWSGKKLTMNYAQRLRLKNALGESLAQVASLKERAAAIANKRGLNNPGASGSGQAAPPASGGNADRGAVPGNGKYRVGQTVRLKNGKSVTIKQINADGTFIY
ncbi:MAG TPA: hypothetical protein VKX49_26150 [Bryobacteraceae bacterium]|nr:hypothetical protein [Bryobacteraceae bacterium]